MCSNPCSGLIHLANIVHGAFLPASPHTHPCSPAGLRYRLLAGLPHLEPAHLPWDLAWGIVVPPTGSEEGSR